MTELIREEADCLAWPWVAPDEFTNASLCFDRERARAGLRTRLREHGCPEITRELVDLKWLHGERLCMMLPALARRTLVADRDGWRLAADVRRPGREILYWRYLSLALPPGLLAAAAARDGASPALHVDILPHGVAPVGPVAHLHLHIGAASSFELLWTHLMGQARSLKLRSDARCPGRWSRERWTATLVRAALARRVFAALREQPEVVVDDIAGRLCECDGDLVRDALAQLASGRDTPLTGLEVALLRRAATHRTRHTKVPRRTRDVWDNDPISDGGDWPEGGMLSAMFAWLAAPTRDGRTLNFVERLFVQYLRVKCLLYRILVHDATDRGLDSFVHTFRQISPYRAGLELVLPDCAMQERGLDLGALEVRTAPPKLVTDVRRSAESLARAAAVRRLEAGWVFHFIRDGRGKTTAARYASLIHDIRADTGRLLRALELHPELLRTVRGLDIAGSERDGPLWLALPAFKRLRALSRELASRHDVAPLRLTLHVGEDFRHLATGLRAIHEPFQWDLIARGDRLGHALALGIDAAHWCARRPHVLVPRWERMLDLAWMIDALEGRAIGLTLAGPEFGLTLARLRGELEAHLRALAIRDGRALGGFLELHRSLLGHERCMSRLLAGRRTAPLPRDPMYLLHLRLFGPPTIQAALDTTCEVETAMERPLLHALSASLARLIALWQLTIEVNPSSNMLIAGFEDPLEQPAFRLSPTAPGDRAPLSISLNADDPLTFSTSLADEYAYTWASLVLVADVPPGVARAWLQEAGAASWRARFTSPQPNARRRADRADD